MPLVFRLTLVIACTVPTFTAVPAFAQPPGSRPRLDLARAYLDRVVAFGFSGQILVLDQGRVVLQRSAGLADRTYGMPMTDTTELAIGSVTKNFTAAGILRLERQGRLQLTDPIARHLPGVPPDKQGVTLHHLLSHTAGLPRDVGGLPAEGTRDTIVARILATPLRSEPGRAFQYSNVGYSLLAAIVEQVAGEPYGHFLGRELFAPLGMRRTGTTFDRARLTRAPARGYNEWKEVAAWTENAEPWRRSGSGNLVSTASDLARWAGALLGGPGLAPGERTAMLTRRATDPDSVGYGYGMFLQELPGGRRLHYHGGDVAGYRAELRVYPDEHRAIIVLTNTEQFQLGVHRRLIANTLARVLRGDSAAVPPPVARDGHRRIGAWYGEYRVAGGGVIRLLERNRVPMLEAERLPAIEALLPARPDSLMPLAAADDWARRAVAAVVFDDSLGAERHFSEAERDFALGFLRSQLRGYIRVLGRPQQVRVLGTVPMPWSAREIRTYVAVRYEDGEVILFLGRDGGTLNDITFEDRPAPVMLPVAVLADGTLGAWDVYRSRTFVIRRRGVDLVIRGTRGEILATRVR